MGVGEGSKKAAVSKWFKRLEQRDAPLHRELDRQLSFNESELRVSDTAPSAESVPRAGIDKGKVSFETLVQQGRPALFILEDQIQSATPLVDSVSQLMVERVTQAAERINPWLPLIGRIDVSNHSAGFPYVGTGWLIQPGLICTNRHVAELVGQRDGRRFTFTRGRFGRDLGVSFNRRREKEPMTTSATDAFEITEIAWIEPANGPDIALLRVSTPEGDGTTPKFLNIADTNGASGDFVVTVGYPARAYEDTIPDQLWMDEIYEGIYDVKRAAPGQLDDPVDGSTTYDCTTLGGASGSPVLSLDSGNVVALHFAGLYKIENYGVPAAILRKYAIGVPSISEAPRSDGEDAADAFPGKTIVTPIQVQAFQGASASITVPLTIRISLGDIPSAAQSDPMISLDAAVASLAAQTQHGVLAVKRGFDGTTDCIVVSAVPELYEVVRNATPASYLGHRVEVRFATIDEQLGLVARMVEAPTAIAYDDARRHAAAFSFDTFTETMDIVAHVGPDQSFDQLASFLKGTQKKLISSMYQFFASHIAEAVEDRLKADVRMRIVLDPATRDPKASLPKDGEFDRSETFARWRETYRFENIYVRRGNGGLVSSAYHIKVSVRDDEFVWLSSGNWTRSSQPFPDRQSHRANGNREWHVIVRSKRLAAMMQAHIEADFQQCEDLGGVAEAFELETMVDVPIEPVVEARFEAPPPLEYSGAIKVTPILTPDKKGRVYTDAVLGLIRSARDQLLFQNQYIRIRRDMSGNLGELVDALIERSHRLRDVRVILRAGDVDDDIAELRRRGMDVMRCVRVLANTHTKGIVVDGARVIIGSQNWSADAVDANRDASLLFENEKIADHFRNVFEMDWVRARPPSPPRSEAAARPVLLAQGNAPPPGYVRMTLSEYRNG